MSAYLVQRLKLPSLPKLANVRAQLYGKDLNKFEMECAVS